MAKVLGARAVGTTMTAYHTIPEPQPNLPAVLHRHVQNGMRQESPEMRDVRLCDPQAAQKIGPRLVVLTDKQGSCSPPIRTYLIETVACILT